MTDIGQLIIDLIELKIELNNPPDDTYYDPVITPPLFIEERRAEKERSLKNQIKQKEKELKWVLNNVSSKVFSPDL